MKKAANATVKDEIERQGQRLSKQSTAANLFRFAQMPNEAEDETEAIRSLFGELLAKKVDKKPLSGQMALDTRSTRESCNFH